MNTSSKLRRRLPGPAGLAAAAMMVLAACIQGPWDYYPENPEVFRGVFVTGYALAGKPVEHVCFERVLDLAEEATQAFAFYDSADVRIAGRFSGASGILILTPVVDTPNCFQGDTGSRVEPDGDYALTARISWDSAGSKVTSVLTATAHVPRLFKLHDSAAAPGVADPKRNIKVPDNIFTREFFLSLPPDILLALGREFPEAVPLVLDSGADTSTALRDYILLHGKAIQSRLLRLLAADQFTYAEGDTLVYLNGPLNTLSHYFSDDRSPDVRAVLITQRFESNSARPETRFDSPVGLKRDSSEYYFPGSIRRLIIYPNAKGANGFNLLDSMGVVNVWFHTLRNRLYFYGFEQAYYDYTSTAVDGSDARVKPKYNVTGGRGIFAGAVPDSFDVHIKIDSSTTKSYPLQITRGLFCHEDGWQDSKDCRDYYPVYCSGKDWKPGDCGQAAVSACLEAEADADTALKARCSVPADSARLKDDLAQRGEDQVCIGRNFPDSIPACAAAAKRCLDTKGINPCKQALWNYCLDRAWRPDQCGPGIASYCHDKPRLSETLCGRADAYCAAHAGSVLCE
jgi:hypothetical protein